MSKKLKKSGNNGCPGFDFQCSSFRSNPFKTFEHMRRFNPVCMVKPNDMWAITRASDIEYVLSNPQIFSAKGFDRVYDADWLSKKCRVPRLILSQDPPDHRKYRQIISKVFSREFIESLEPLMRSTAKSLLINFDNAIRTDFVQQFSYPYIGKIMRHLIGLDKTQSYQEIKEWVELEEQVTFSRPDDSFIKAYEAITLKQHKFYEEVFKIRRDKPQDDLVSVLINAEVDNKKLSDRELYGIMSLIILAGFSTTVQMLNNGIIQFSRRPELVEKLKKSPELVPAFVEELLRYSPAGIGTLRITTGPVVLANVTIPKGEMVMAVLASANRDPHRFANPNEFDLFRPNAKRHMAFGHGIHSCIGASLARLELKVAFEILLQSFDAFHCPPHEDLVWEDSCFIHGVSELAVQFSKLNIKTKEQV